jgi:protein TonB
MNKTFITILLLSISSICLAQNYNAANDTIQPEFPGGDGELMPFIQRNVTYPQPELMNGIQGKVWIRFVVMETGDITDVEVMRSVSPGLDKEAVKVVKMLPKFKPGSVGGKPVRVYFNLPVNFKLN